MELPAFEMGKTNKSPEYLAKFPMGKVPALETADGKTLYESGAIAYYGEFDANERIRGGMMI